MRISLYRPRKNVGVLPSNNSHLIREIEVDPFVLKAVGLPFFKDFLQALTPITSSQRIHGPSSGCHGIPLINGSNLFLCNNADSKCRDDFHILPPLVPETQLFTTHTANVPNTSETEHLTDEASDSPPVCAHVTSPGGAAVSTPPTPVCQFEPPGPVDETVTPSSRGYRWHGGHGYPVEIGSGNPGRLHFTTEENQRTGEPTATFGTSVYPSASPHLVDDKVSGVSAPKSQEKIIATELVASKCVQSEMPAGPVIFLGSLGGKRSTSAGLQFMNSGLEREPPLTAMDVIPVSERQEHLRRLLAAPGTPMGMCPPCHPSVTLTLDLDNAAVPPQAGVALNSLQPRAAIALNPHDIQPETNRSVCTADPPLLVAEEMTEMHKQTERGL